MRRIRRRSAGGSARASVPRQRPPHSFRSGGSPQKNRWLARRNALERYPGPFGAAMDHARLKGSIAAMLAQNGCRAEPIVLQPCDGGGNNRVFIVSAGGTKIFAKWYYADAADRRDRLHAEWNFINC